MGIQLEVITLGEWSALGMGKGKNKGEMEEEFTLLSYRQHL